MHVSTQRRTAEPYGPSLPALCCNRSPCGELSARPGVLFGVATSAQVDADGLRDVLELCRRSGADYADLFIEDTYTQELVVQDDSVDDVVAGHDRGVGVRVIAGTTTGFASTADMGPAAVRAAALQALANARRGVGESAASPLSQHVHLRHGHSHELRSRSLVAADILESHRATASGHGDSRIETKYVETDRLIRVLSTSGVDAADRQLRSKITTTTVVPGSAGPLRGRMTDGRSGEARLTGQAIQSNVASALTQALTKADAVAAPTGEHTVVLQAGSAGVLLHEACGHGLEADKIVTGASNYSDLLGEYVASPLVTVIDDGTDPLLWGSSSIDDEGSPTVETTLIQDGRLVGYVHHRASAAAFGVTSCNARRQSYRNVPTVRMTNTMIAPGTSDPHQLVADVDAGIYVAQLRGGEVNSSSGVFVFGTAQAYLIERGEITRPIGDTSLVGTDIDVLTNIDGVGSDLVMAAGGTCGKEGQSVPVGFGCPTLRVRRMTIGGY